MTPSVNNSWSSNSNQNNNGRDQNNNFNGTFNVNNYNTPPESVLEKLTLHIAPNTLHIAKARANQRACLKGTRGGFIEELGE
ncbi:hypothetical protein V5O48_019675, partial [Marasmius crinis-equi]